MKKQKRAAAAVTTGWPIPEQTEFDTAMEKTAQQLVIAILKGQVGIKIMPAGGVNNSGWLVTLQVPPEVEVPEAPGAQGSTEGG